MPITYRNSRDYLSTLFLQMRGTLVEVGLKATSQTLCAENDFFIRNRDVLHETLTCHFSSSSKLCEAANHRFISASWSNSSHMISRRPNRCLYYNGTSYLFLEFMSAPFLTNTLAALDVTLNEVLVHHYFLFTSAPQPSNDANVRNDAIHQKIPLVLHGSYIFMVP